MREDDIDQAERQAVLENDRRVLEQRRGSTFHQHAQSLADELSQGRFAATGSPTVIASRPNPSAQYPAASSAHQTELPPEQPLGYRIDAMPEQESSMAIPTSPSVGDTGPASHGDAPLSDTTQTGEQRAEGAGPLCDGERDA